MININDIKPDDIEALARAYIYNTSTQRYVNLTPPLGLLGI